MYAHHQILNPLKEIQFKPEFYDAMRKEGENKEETDEKYETLYDFVNISSLQELNSKAQEAYGAYEGSLNSLRYSINFLIKTIEGTLNSIKETEESRNTLVKKIQHCNTEITEISQQINTHRKLLDYKATEENKNDKSPIVDAMLMLSNKAKDVLCRLSEAETEIKKINGIKKEKHIALTANTQIVKEKLGKLEQEMAMFETAYSALRNIYAQCDSLIECYSKYSTSYQSFLKEVNRRKQYDQVIEGKIKEIRNSLCRIYEQEYQTRLSFKSAYLNNIPLLLQPIVKENPIKYEIYPLSSWSITKKLSYNE